MKSRNILLLKPLALFILLLAVSCNKNDQEPQKVPHTETLIRLTVQMPQEEGLRLDITPESAKSSVKWKEGDKISLLFVKGEVKKTVSDIPLIEISADGKSASFAFSQPAGITYPYDLYGIYGASFTAADNAVVELKSHESEELTLAYATVRCAMRFELKNITGAELSAVTFQHLGSIMDVEVKNLSAADITLNSMQFVGNMNSYNWIYGATEAPTLDLMTGTYTDKKESSQLDFQPNGGLMIPKGTAVHLYRWFIPTEMPDASKNFGIRFNHADGIGMGSLVGKAFQKGKHTRLKLVWDGTDIRKPSMVDLKIEGQLLHTDSSPNLIAMVYTKADGKIYYNGAKTSVAWTGEVDLGTGSQARVAIAPDGTPHVVYKSADNKIIHRALSGLTWSNDVIASNEDGGSCSKPDVAVDNSGYTHITYTDNRGEADHYNEIMYATNTSGSFVKSVIFDGYFDSDWGGEYYNGGSMISLDAEGKYCIVAHYQYYEKGYGSSYSYKLKTSSASGGVETVIAMNQMSVLIKESGEYKTANLTVSGTGINLTNKQNVNTAATLHSLWCTSSASLVGGVNGSANLISVNSATGTENLHTEKVKTGTTVGVAKVSSASYVIFTDNADGFIKIKTM